MCEVEIKDGSCKGPILKVWSRLDTSFGITTLFDFFKFLISEGLTPFGYFRLFTYIF